MPDPVNPASILPTGGNSLVGDLLVAPGQLPPANGVQSPNNAFPPAMGGAILPEGSLTRDQVQALTTSWQNRVSELQSQKDKAIAERDKAIALQVQMQQQITTLQEQSSAGLTSAADAAQNAMNQATQLRTENDALKGELRRFQALEAHPNLAPYRKFIPTSGSEEDLAKAITELNAIREQDLQKVAAGQQPLFAQTPPGQTPGTPGSTPVNPALSPFQQLYGGRPNVNPMAGMAPMQIPGSTPASMSPSGGSNTNQAIAQMLKEARETGSQEKYAEAVQRVTTLLPQAIQEQMGR
jgi:hypothetical protein